MLDWWTVTGRNIGWGVGVTTEHAKYLQTWEDSKCNHIEHIGLMVPPRFSKWLGEQLPRGSFVDLFCGPGGFSKGFVDAGHEQLMGYDYDKSVLKCYKENVGDCELLDLTKKHELPKYKPTYVIGSPPCNDFTLARIAGSAGTKKT